MRTRTRRAIEIVSRRDVAAMLSLHPDSISRALHEGLASAVIRWGGHSQTMEFDRALVLRWDFARSCRRENGSPCVQCRLVLEDCQCAGAHLIEARHGIHTTCDPAICGQTNFCWPCRMGGTAPSFLATEPKDDGPTQ